MDRERRGGDGRPERPIAGREVATGEPQELGRQEEEEGGDGRMPEDAAEVVPPGVEPPNGELGREEEPGQRLIDPEQRGPPCPAELGPPEPAEGMIRQEI